MDESTQLEALCEFRDLPHAGDYLRSVGLIRRQVEDFKVEEVLPFVPTDDGEHLLLFVSRGNMTTREVQRRLAQTFHVKSADIGYIGLKDKRSIAKQWFSVPVPTPSVPISAPELEILQQRRHHRKLRPTIGCLNRFEIRVRGVVPNPVTCHSISSVPNYYGQQRFGRDGRNVQNAMKWVREGKPRISPFLKSIYISSMRSYVFNRVLARRVQRGDWCTVIDGDVETDEGFPSGPLWGRGRCLTDRLAKEIEDSVVKEVASIADALEWVGLKQERRSLVLKPTDFDYKIELGTALVRFALPSGSFATTVLREYFDLRDEQN